MPFKPNYRMRRADRDRAQKARNEEKAKKRQVRAEERKMEDRVPTAEPTDSGSGKGE